MRPPTFKQTPQRSVAQCGEQVKFMCHIQGMPMPSVQWFHNDQQIRMASRVYMKFGRESGQWLLHLDDVIKADAGVFRCVATNPVGEASVETELVVEGDDVTESATPMEYVTDQASENADVIINGASQVTTTKVEAELIQDVVTSSHEITEGEEHVHAAILDGVMTSDVAERKFKKEFRVEEDTQTESFMRSEHELAMKAGDMTSYDMNVVEQTINADDETRPIDGATVTADLARMEGLLEKEVERDVTDEKSIKGSSDAGVTQMQLQTTNVTRDATSDPAKTHVTVTTKTGRQGDVSVVETETVAVTTKKITGVVKEVRSDTRVVTSENEMMTSVEEFNQSAKSITVESSDVIMQDTAAIADVTDATQLTVTTATSDDVTVQQDAVDADVTELTVDVGDDVTLTLTSDAVEAEVDETTFVVVNGDDAGDVTLDASTDATFEVVADVTEEEA